MTTLLLIRHGENDYHKKGRLPGNIPGIHLNLAGKKQAQLLADGLSPLPIRAIYSSPLERAVETAEPLAAKNDLQIIKIPELKDTDIGKWTGRSIKAVRLTKSWRTVQSNPSLVRFPGGESILQVQYRVVNSIEGIRTRHRKGAYIAIFFHADPIKVAITHYLGLALDHFQRLTINPGSVSILKFDHNTPRIIGLNLRPPIHLPGK